MDTMKQIVKQFEKSFVIEECEGICAGYKQKIEKLKTYGKKVK